MKKIVRVILTSVVLVAMPVILSAQVCLRHPNDGLPPGPGNHPVGYLPVGAPIDGGVSILLLCSMAFGIKKLRNVKKIAE